MAKVGIKSNLTQSIIVLTIFWFSVGVFLYSLVPVEEMDKYYSKIGYEPSENISVYNQMEILTGSIYFRLEESWPPIVLGLIFSLLSLLVFFLSSLFFRKRNSMSDSYESMYCEITKIPRMNVYLVPSDKKIVKAKYPKHQALLNNLLNYAKANHNAFIGSAHGDKGLYKHTLSVLKKAKSYENAHPLLELAAAAHDLGKVKTFEGTSPNGKYHDIEGGKILRHMPSFNSLSYSEQLILQLAITFQHHSDKLPRSLPSLNEEEYQSMTLLLDQIKEIDGFATKVEKEAHIQDAQVDLNELIYDGFVELLKSAPFYNSSSSPKSSNVGYRWGDRLYLFEFMVREFLKDFVGTKYNSVLDLDKSSKHTLGEGMKRFLNLMNDHDFLVLKSKTGNGTEYELPIDFPFWDVKSGDYDFKSMIVLQIHGDLKAHMPGETSYPVEIVCPYKMAKAKVLNAPVIEKANKSQSKGNQPSVTKRKSQSYNGDIDPSGFKPSSSQDITNSDIDDVLAQIDVNTSSEGKLNTPKKPEKDISEQEPELAPNGVPKNLF